jgi:hypothetical protein
MAKKLVSLKLNPNMTLDEAIQRACPQYFLTLNFFCAACLQSNCRGETDGCRMLLQKITLGGGMRALLSGVGIRWAERESLAALLGKEQMFRHHHEEGTLTGYSYGPKHRASVKAAIKDLFELGMDPKDFADWAFGMMVVEKDVVNNDLSKGQYKMRSSILVGDAISLSPFLGESTFHQGTNPKVKEIKDAQGNPVMDENGDAEVRAGDIAPYSMERDFNRYAFRQTFDLLRTPPVILEALLKVITEGIQVGGGHARAESELVPDAVLWHIYSTPGSSGMYLPAFEADPAKILDLTPFYKGADERGVILNSAGNFMGKTKGHPDPIKLRDLHSVIRAKVDTILAEAKVKTDAVAKALEEESSQKE